MKRLTGKVLVSPRNTLVFIVIHIGMRLRSEKREVLGHHRLEARLLENVPIVTKCVSDHDVVVIGVQLRSIEGIDVRGDL